MFESTLFESTLALGDHLLGESLILRRVHHEPRFLAMTVASAPEAPRPFLAPRAELLRYVCSPARGPDSGMQESTSL
jgi:hypothetical protein